MCVRVHEVDSEDTSELPGNRQAKSRATALASTVVVTSSESIENMPAQGHGNPWAMVLNDDLPPAACSLDENSYSSALGTISYGV